MRLMGAAAVGAAAAGERRQKRGAKLLIAHRGASAYAPENTLEGFGRALEIGFFGESIDATEAQRIGLINWVFPPEELLKRTLERAEQLASGARKAIGLFKRDVNRAMDVDLETALDYESYQQETAGRTDDYREAITAFFEKRKPDFTGT